jgi:prophage tail gpP-like protein
MSDFTPSQPEKEQVSLVLKAFTEEPVWEDFVKALPGRGSHRNIEIKNFTEYSFNSNFLSPTDGFSFTIGAERLTDEMKQWLIPGSPVELRIGDAIQATGFIDSVEISASRGSGTTWRIEGRDILSPAVDAGADPTISFKEGQTLADALKTLFKPFGWSQESQFAIANDANLTLKSPKFRAKTKKSQAKGFGKRAIRDYKIHQLRAYPREGVFEFASRIAQRHGLWLWASADGKQLIASTPNFDREPYYTLIRKADGTTNVLDGSVKRDISEQATHIVADGYAAGGEFGKSPIKCLVANGTVTSPQLDISLFVKYGNAGANVINGPAFPLSSGMVVPRRRTVYLHDDEAHTQEQLDNFVRRELALMQRKSITLRYTVEGHGQNTPFGFQIWTVDTTVKVEDEVAGLNEVFYVFARTFHKSRSGGTTTSLELIRLNTMVFSDTGK